MRNGADVLPSDTVINVQTLVLSTRYTFGASVVKVERGDDLSVVLEDLGHLQRREQCWCQHDRLSMRGRVRCDSVAVVVAAARAVVSGVVQVGHGASSTSER